MAQEIMAGKTKAYEVEATYKDKGAQAAADLLRKEFVDAADPSVIQSMVKKLTNDTGNLKDSNGNQILYALSLDEIMPKPDGKLLAGNDTDCMLVLATKEKLGELAAASDTTGKGAFERLIAQNVLAQYDELMGPASSNNVEFGHDTRASADCKALGIDLPDVSRLAQTYEAYRTSGAKIAIDEDLKCPELGDQSSIPGPLPVDQGPAKVGERPPTPVANQGPETVGKEPSPPVANQGPETVGKEPSPPVANQGPEIVGKEPSPPVANQGPETVGKEPSPPVANQGPETVGKEPSPPVANQGPETVGKEPSPPVANQGPETVGKEPSPPAANQGPETVGKEPSPPVENQGPETVGKEPLAVDKPNSSARSKDYVVLPGAGYWDVAADALGFTGGASGKSIKEIRKYVNAHTSQKDKTRIFSLMKELQRNNHNKMLHPQGKLQVSDEAIERLL